MLNPYLVWVKIAGVAILILSLLFGIYQWRKSIINDTTNKVNAIWLQREEKANAEAQKILAEKNIEIDKHQTSIDIALKTITNKNQEIANAKKSYDTLRDQYVSGAKRLSVRVTSPSQTDRAKEDSHTSTSIPHNNETRELMPEVSGNILSFARGYSENLRNLNECIVLYNAVRNGE